jgi:hypothetical protein
MQAAIIRSAVAVSGCGFGYAALSSVQGQDGNRINAMELKASPGSVTHGSAADSTVQSYAAHTKYGRRKLRARKNQEDNA